MKLSLISLLLVMISGSSRIEKEKFFTGIIEYKYTYESEHLDVDSLAAAKPYKSIFRYDLNNYQSQFIGKDTFTYFYDGRLNKCISETNRLKDYECEDYALPNDSVISFKVYETDEKVMELECIILEYQSTRFWNRYYVSKELKIAPGTYQKHNAYNWKFYGEKAEGGLILKLEHRFKNYTMQGTATMIELQDSVFQALEVDEQIFVKTCAGKK